MQATDICGAATQTHAQYQHAPVIPNTARMPAPAALRLCTHFQCRCSRKRDWRERTKPQPCSGALGLSQKLLSAPKQHPCNGCWKQLFKIQQPLCLTTRSDLWYFLPKQFICLAQQLINSRGHPSLGLARAGPAAGPDGGCVSGINTILIDYMASGGLPNTRGAHSTPPS